MAWSASGLYVSNMINWLNRSIALDWLLLTSKIALYNNSWTQDYTVAAGSAIYSSTNEVNGPAAWPVAGILVSAAAAGSASLAPTLTQSPSKYVMADYGQDLSVASTTIPAAYGAVIYQDALSPKAAFMGMYFGGLGYATTAGTFAITFAAGGIWNIQCTA